MGIFNRKIKVKMELMPDKLILASSMIYDNMELDKNIDEGYYWAINLGYYYVICEIYLPLVTDEDGIAYIMENSINKYRTLIEDEYFYILTESYKYAFKTIEKQIDINTCIPSLVKSYAECLYEKEEFTDEELDMCTNNLKFIQNLVKSMIESIKIVK